MFGLAKKQLLIYFLDKPPYQLLRFEYEMKVALFCTHHNVVIVIPLSYPFPMGLSDGLNTMHIPVL